MGVRELRRISEFPSVTLGHVLSRDHQPGMTVIRYKPWGTHIRRPGQCFSFIEVQCGACDSPVRLRVDSVDRVKKLRRRGLFAVGLGLLLATGLTFAAFVWTSAITQSHTLSFWCVTAGFISLIVIFFGSGFWLPEHGITSIDEPGEVPHTYQHFLVEPSTWRSDA